MYSGDMKKEPQLHSLQIATAPVQYMVKADLENFIKD